MLDYLVKYFYNIHKHSKNRNTSTFYLNNERITINGQFKEYFHVKLKKLLISQLFNR